MFLWYIWPGSHTCGMGWGFIRVTGTCEEKICPQQHPYCPGITWLPISLMFHKFCTISMDCGHVQWSWRDFSTLDFPGFNIYYQGQQSTDPDSHEIHPEIQYNFHKHTGPPQHLSVLQTSSPLPSLGFHTRACRSHGDCFRTDLQPYSLWPVSCNCEKHHSNSLSLLPKMDFIKGFLLAMGLVSLFELQERDISADSKWKWTRFGEENAFLRV